MSRKFETEIEIAASAAAVWKALTEADGIRSWFAPDARVTPGAGGEIWVSWGPGMEGASRIEIWEPGTHLRQAHDGPGGGEPKVVDYTIEAREGGTTILRLVNSGFGAEASFDDELESTSQAWPLFLLLLKESAEREYHTCQNVTIMHMSPLARDEVRQRVEAVLSSMSADIRFQGPTGNVCYELHEPNRPLLAVFCEKGGGGTFLTIMCLLYDTKPGQDERVKGLAESIVAKIV